MSRALVALLRGVNAGRAERVAAADPRVPAAGLGYGDVRTLLDSGNVVFTATDAEPPDECAARTEAAVVARNPSVCLSCNSSGRSTPRRRAWSRARRPP